MIKDAPPTEPDVYFMVFLERPDEAPMREILQVNAISFKPGILCVNFRVSVDTWGPRGIIFIRSAILKTILPKKVYKHKIKISQKECSRTSQLRTPECSSSAAVYLAAQVYTAAARLHKYILLRKYTSSIWVWERSMCWCFKQILICKIFQRAHA